MNPVLFPLEKDYLPDNQKNRLIRGYTNLKETIYNQHEEHCDSSFFEAQLQGYKLCLIIMGYELMYQ